MALVNKLDSNVTELRYAEEDSPKVVNVGATWYPLEPNSYADFGATIAKIARNPINRSRQRKKGVTTDLDANGGINSDLTQSNLQDIFQGLMFADLREKGIQVVTAIDLDGANPDEYEVASTAGFLVNDLIIGVDFAEAANNALNVVTAVVLNTSVEVANGQLVTEVVAGAPYIVIVGHQFASGDATIDAAGTLPRLETTVKDLTQLGLIPGEFVFIGGDTAVTQFATGANNGYKRVLSIETNAITFDKSDETMVTDAGAAKTIQLFIPSRCLKNETGTLIVRRTYQLERALGAPDDSLPNDVQYEYLTGSVLNTATWNIAPADKITIDLGFISMDQELYTGAEGEKAGTRPDLIEADAFNTSTDFSRIRLATLDGTTEAPTPLFAFVTDLTLTVDNKVTPNKAVGVLGAFDLTAGTFEVGGSMTAYFVGIESVEAVRDNADVTLDFVIASGNAGIAVDVPLIALGNGRINIEQDQPITIPLEMPAATGAKYHANLDHTLLISYFDFLPDAAMV